MKYAGADWLSNYKNLSSFGATVANILGQVFQGIYHIDSDVLKPKIDWMSNKTISITVYSDLATFNFPRLTLIILESIKEKVSVTIGGSFKGYTKIEFDNIDSGWRLEHLSGRESSFEQMALLYKTSRSRVLWEDIEPRTRMISYTRSPLTMMELVGLVIDSHGSAIRASIRGFSPSSVELMLSQRVRTGSMFERHPTMSDAIKTLGFAPIPQLTDVQGVKL